MGKHVAGDAPEMDRLVDEASAAIGAAIDALRVPRLMGVVLGGGYGRGEGGVMATGGAQTLSNDLDFYVVAEDGSSADDISAIGRALAPISAEWTRKLGVDVDFCTPKTPWRLRHDQERVMIQELVHGYFDVAGAKGETLFAGVDRRGPEEFPWMEAARLMMNRGVGLMLALASGDNRREEHKQGGPGGRRRASHIARRLQMEGHRESAGARRQAVRGGGRVEVPPPRGSGVRMGRGAGHMARRA